MLLQLIYRPRTIEDSHDETSRPTITDDNNVTLVTTTTTTTTTNNEQHPADVTSASMTSDSTVNTPQSTIAGAGSTDPSSGVSVVDDRNSTSDQREVVSEDPITDVAPHRTQPSAQTRLQSTTEDPVTARHSRRVDLLDQATMTMTNTTPPTSSTKLRNHQSLNAAPTDTQNSHRQVSSQQPQHEEHKSQQGNVVCENDVCRLRVVTSNKQCHVARTFVTNHVSGAASDLLSTTTRDAKSVRFTAIVYYPRKFLLPSQSDLKQRYLRVFGKRRPMNKNNNNNKKNKMSSDMIWSKNVCFMIYGGAVLV